MRSIILALCLSITAFAAAQTATINNVVYSVNGAEARVDKSPDARGAITIPDAVEIDGVSYPVTSIADSAFCNGYEVTDMVLPKTITEIGAFAFFNTSITHPIHTKKIFAYLPYDVAGEYTVPRSITEIASGAFAGCGDLNSVVLPKGIARIGARAFWGTNISAPIYTATEFVYLPPIYAGKYTVPDGITDILDGAFYGSPYLTRVVLPESVSRIGHHAFYQCMSLDSVILPRGLQEIEPYAFFSCERLITVSLPSHLNQIGDYAFYGCKWLAHINFDACEIGSIGDYAFFGCVAISSARLREGLYHIGERAFNQCNDLAEVTIPATVETVGDEPFEHTKLAEPLYSRTVFIRLPESTEGIYTVPDGITTIGYRAFEFTQKLESVVLPATVRTIGKEAFRYSAISSVNVPATATVGEGAFEGCKNLKQ